MTAFLTTLLRLSLLGSLLAVTLCHEKTILQERLVSIVKLHKRTPAALLLTLALVLAVGGCSLVAGTQREEAPDPVATLELPQSDVTLHLDMARKDVEALLGEGKAFYAESMNFTYPPVAYDLTDGLLLVEYYQMTKAQGERVKALYCFSGAGYSSNPRVNEQFTPEAQKMFREAGPFQFQAVQGTGYGDSYAELKARFPDGKRLVQPQGGDQDKLMTMFETHSDEATVLYYLTEETGVYQMEVLKGGGWLEFDATEYLAHSITGFGYSPTEGNMTWGTLETTLGPGTSHGGVTVYGSGDDTLLVTGTGDDCVLEATGANWITGRGIHVGHTLADLNERYDGSLQSDETGRYYQMAGEKFVLTFYLDDTDTITSIRLENRGEAS